MLKKTSFQIFRMADVQKTYALVVGVVLLLLGLLGFVMASPLFGLFGVNALQNVLHLLGGALGLYFGTKGNAKAFNLWLGVVALVVGLLWFVASGFLSSLLNINETISYLHILLGLVSIGVAYFVKG
jgi:hypothetical protein